jgi:DNA-binding transcriptional LysR family regulator
MFETKNILCASPDYIKTHGKPKHASDLLHATFISHTLRKDNFNLPLANGKRLPCAKPVLYMNHFEALNQACCDGIGLFLTADTLVTTELKSKKLIQLLPDIHFATYDIYMFYRPYDFELPKIRAFVEFYLAKLRHT